METIKEKYYSYNYINHTVPSLDLSYYTDPFKLFKKGISHYNYRSI